MGWGKGTIGKEGDEKGGEDGGGIVIEVKIVILRQERGVVTSRESARRYHRPTDL